MSYEILRGLINNVAGGILTEKDFSQALKQNTFANDVLEQGQNYANYLEYEKPPVNPNNLQSLKGIAARLAGRADQQGAYGHMRSSIQRRGLLGTGGLLFVGVVLNYLFGRKA